jgi:hypothetical protein
MAGGSYLKSAGLAALAAGIALFGAPLAAQAQVGAELQAKAQVAQAEGRWRGGHDRASGHAGGNWRGQAARENAPSAASAQAPQQRAWNGENGGSWRGRGSDQGGGANWRGQAARENAPSAAPAQAPQQRAWNGENGGGWRGRGGRDAVAAPVPAAPPVVRAPQPQGNSAWRGRGGSNGESAWRGRTGWNGSASAPAQPVPEARSTGWRRSPQQQGEAVTQNWRDRNDGDRRGTWSRDGRRDDGSRWNQNNTRTRDGWNGDNRRYEGNRWSGDSRQWNRDWRRNDRYNWQSYRTHHRDIFRAGRYYSPYRNHYYSRLSIGIYLNSLFYSNNYWINDPWQYRLPDVYGPYRWIRYYDDAVLVDVYSGEVVDVIYDFFW